MAEKTLSAPLAIIKVKGVDGVLKTIGKIRNIRVTENVRRGRVTGLGELTPSELPALEWSGTVNIGQYAIPQNKTLAGLAMDRNFDSVNDFVKHLIFNEGVQIDILKKVKLKVDGQNISKPVAEGDVGQETFCSIVGFHLTSEGIDISEGQIGGRDVTGEYMNPVLYNF